MQLHGNLDRDISCHRAAAAIITKRKGLLTNAADSKEAKKGLLYELAERSSLRQKGY